MFHPFLPHFASSRNGSALTKSSKYHFESAGCSYTLIIKNASMEDIAQYTCVAENVQTQTDLELTGGDEPIVLAEAVESQVDVIKGQEICLTTTFTKESLQTPKVQWFFQGQLIQEKSEKVNIILFVSFSYRVD